MDNIKAWKQTGINSVVILIVLYLHQKMQNTHFIKDKFYVILCYFHCLVQYYKIIVCPNLHYNFYYLKVQMWQLCIVYF